jgi:hypothetical protein
VVATHLRPQTLRKAILRGSVGCAIPRLRGTPYSPSRLQKTAWDERLLFLKFWTHESKTTRNVLARISEGSDYRPDPKSRTAREIAWQIVCEEGMIIEALESSKAEWVPTPIPATMNEGLEAYEKHSAGMADRWRALRGRTVVTNEPQEAE